MKNKEKKTKEIKARCTDSIFRKLSAICSVTGKTKTDVITDLIHAEFDRNKKYEIQYYSDLNKDA